MAARRNGPRAGPVLGIMWETMAVGVPMVYPGTPNGARTNTSRANKRYPKLSFRTFKRAKRIYVERVK